MVRGAAAGGAPPPRSLPPAAAASLRARHRRGSGDRRRAPNPLLQPRRATTPLPHPPAAAATAPLDAAPTAAALSDADRASLAASLGYRSIGAELPDTVSLTDVIKSLPPSVFDINPVRAWGAVAVTIASVALSVYLISIAPPYLLPLAWAFAGTAWTGLFVVGHDCGHRSFSHNKLVEDIVGAGGGGRRGAARARGESAVSPPRPPSRPPPPPPSGTLMFAPLLYPFEPWRIKHNHHHAHTNKLVEDTAWHPVPKAEADSWGPVRGAVYKFFLGSPLKLWASVGHWAIWHFNLSLYTAKQQPRVLVSLAAVGAFAAIVLPAIAIYGGGVGAVAKYWLAPWLGYHFWMSTFTVVHHTAPHIPFKPAGQWNAAKAQLSGTVHCDYPALVEFLCHDINVHVPHHVSSKIPWYNLRAATESLRANWGRYMTEATVNW